jgi:hypothetical protein
VTIIHRLIYRVTGLDPVTIKSDDDKRAYNWLRHVYCVMFLSLLIGLPSAVYVFITIYLPALRK